MSRFLRDAEGRGRNAPADRRDQLELVVLFANDLICSEGSGTSDYIGRWNQIEETAESLLILSETPAACRFGRLIEKWVQETVAELETYFGVADREGGEL